MESRWSDADAARAVEEYGRKGVSADVALRTYTTRLLGRVPALVLHGGGNTSVKTQAKDLLGETHEVLCVKGSGWDMGTIEPAGLPAVKLGPLRKLRALPSLSDEDMVNFQRINLLDSAAPNPSVETLLHAFLPHKFIDHTHAAAVLSLVDQPNGEELVAEVYDGSMGFVPYVIPGFGLAKLAAEVHDAKPDVAGLILHKHGIFTFAEDRARGLRADDRHGVAGRGAAGEGAAQRVRAGGAAGRAGNGCGGRAHRPRRLRGAGYDGRRRAATLRADVPHRRRRSSTTSTAPILPTTASAAW